MAGFYIEIWGEFKIALKKSVNPVKVFFEKSSNFFSSSIKG